MADEDEADEEQRAARKRASAQQAAADLVRMGIDPRSLGLDPPEEPGRADRGHDVGERPPDRSVAADLSPPTLDAPPLDTPSSDAPPPGAPGTSSGGAGREDAATDAGARVYQLRGQRHGAQAAAGPSTASTEGAAGDGLTPVAGGRARGRVGAGPLERLLAATLVDRPVPAQAGRLLRSVTRGLATPDAAAAAGDERELVAAVRGRHGGSRVVAFHAGKGGVGTTSVALGVGAALAALRDDRTVLADLRAGTASLGETLTGTPAPTARALARAAAAGSTAPEPGALPGGLGLVDGSGWDTPLRRSDLPELLALLTADHAFVLLDVGNDAGESAYAGLSRADLSVVVTEAGPSGLDAARVAIDRLADIDPYAPDGCVHVVVCTSPAPYREVLRRAREQLAVEPARLVVVPPDPHLAAGERFDAAALLPATREALLQAAAAVVLGGRGDLA